jgi:PhoPQ-activated pathogenicity-related protein
VPIVLDLLNLVENMHHMVRAYGGWSWAMADYVAAGFPTWMDTE